MIAAIPLPRTRVPMLAAGAIGVGLLAGALVSFLNPIVALLAVAAAGVAVAGLALPMGRFWLLAGVITLLPFGAVPRLGIQPTLLDGALAILLVFALMRFLLVEVWSWIP